MKKFFALLLALVMALSLVACGNKDNAADDQQGDGATYPEYFAGMDELIAAARLYWRGMMDESTLCAVLGDRSYLSGEYWRTSPPPEPLEAGRLRAVKRVFMGEKIKAKK